MAPVQESRFSCSCGALTGHVNNIGSGHSVHLLCFCPDCRAADLYLDQPDPDASGVDLVQVSPSDIVIESGAAHLALMRLYPKGLLRWYADCCNTPMFTTPATPKVRLAGFRTHRLDHPNEAGPVVARGFVPKPNGKRGHENLMRIVWPVAVRSLAGLMNGDWRDTPFFDPQSRAPSREAKVLTREERHAVGLVPKSG